MLTMECIVFCNTCMSSSLWAQQIVSGTVTDESGVPMPGATVVVQCTNNGTTTDFDGKYQIQASHGTATGAKNLYFQFIVEQRSGYLTVSGSHLYNLVNGNTPRLLATPGETERAKKYFDGTELNTGKGGYFAEDSSFPIIDYIETKLIEAEAAHRSGEDALTPFNDVRGQLALDYSGSFPDSSSSGDMLLKEILEEKYISLIGSLQVFHDVRRTKNLIGVPVKVNDKTKIPQRFLYPQSEINSNESFPGLKDLFEETPVNK